MLAGMGAALLLAGGFAPPAEGPVAFRRDQIPLDVDAMSGLSKQLESLARGLDPATARERRGAAQMLALALALNPANATARELVADYQKNRHQSAADAQQLAKLRSRIAPVLAWLETPEAGRHGHALAACLKDVLAMVDPQHPDADEKGVWAGWIPDLAAYETKTLSKQEDPKPQAPEGVSPAKKEMPLSIAEVYTLLWQKVGHDESAHWALAVAPLQMAATQVAVEGEGSPLPFTLEIDPGQNGGLFTQTNAMLLKLLANSHPALPPGYRISITSADLEQSIRSLKLQTLSAAAAVLASSAVTGREPEAIILGQIDEFGAYQLPTGFWDQLQALGKGNGQRLVLPVEAATYLPALLALEKPGFFLEYEVLLAANFKQLLERSYKVPDQALAKTTAKFRVVRQRADAQDVRQYLSNHFVRQRLADISQEAPFHESAKMLLIQATGQHPTLVARTVLAAELRRALDPMSWVVPSAASPPSDDDTPPRITLDYEFTPADIAKLAATIDRCHSQVEALDRHAEKGDRELLEQTRKVINALRTLARTTRHRGDYFPAQKSVRAAYSDLTSLHKELLEKLRSDAGE